MTNKIIRSFIFTAIIMLYLLTHADLWLEKIVTGAWSKIIHPLFIFLSILFILCYRSVSRSMLASVAISLLSFAVFIGGLLLWLSCFFSFTPNPDKLKEDVGFLAVLLVTALSVHLWGFLINSWIKRMNLENDPPQT